MALQVLFIIFLYNTALCSAARDTYSVVNFGATPGGKTDSSEGFLAAWTAACGSDSPSTVYVPSGRFLVSSPTVFSGKDCKSTAITFRIDGSLVAPSDYRVLGNADTWLTFESVTGVTISGGVLDGQGAGLWACKASRGGCPGGAVTLRFTNSKNVVVSGLTSVNSQLYHIVVDGCNNAQLQGIKVSASGQSPNTDGIHVQGSTGVTILSSQLATGDDCISIGAGSANLWIENVACGPGHGISIGSLGKQFNEAGVHNVTVKTVTFTGTENGLRIKSWARPSNGYVRNVLFQHATMIDVQNPIIINQNYCPDNKGCPDKASGVRISDVTYQDIHGSSATEVAVNLDCSPKNPCTNIVLEDVNLNHRRWPARSSCAHADGSTYGVVQPSDCLN
ncbi:hypothetical protein Nepgr_031534 [Nepenthes gracilis]|uniref:Polygalacturonase n=1 Tax=Nepenthes gracilis TaxID=150966 RepID=A0AAD3TIP7_NEPGR|nr:hypothetical protein Nepgr_031534 [Nepenthes gracilis]